MAIPGVHIEWVTKNSGVAGQGPDGRPVPVSIAELPHVDGMTAVDMAIGADAIVVPDGVAIMLLEAPAGTAFRYAVGADNTVTVPGSNGLRHPGGTTTFARGVTPGTWIKTAADTGI